MENKCQGCGKIKKLKLYLISSGNYLDSALYCTSCAKYDVKEGFKVEEIIIKDKKEVV